MRILFSALLVGALVTAAGCGKEKSVFPDTTPVSGTVTVNGEATGGVELKFIPQGDTKGNGGSAVTDASGKYEASTPRQQKGLVPGKYKVVASRRLNADGSAADLKVPAANSPAAESLPSNYSDPDHTELTLTVAAGDSKQFDFALKAKKK